MIEASHRAVTTWIDTRLKWTLQKWRDRQNRQKQRQANPIGLDDGNTINPLDNLASNLGASRAMQIWQTTIRWVQEDPDGKSSYRDVKSDGWQWHKTRLREPARAERIWLAMAVANLWTVTVGTNEQRHLSDKFNNQIIIENCENQQFNLKPTNRTISCFLKGLLNILADLICGKGISLNGLFPQSSFVVNTS
ncbi:MAG: hypothetical protein F6K14_01260 [Symploca sp. SIO2C1]|nr:hypothetical protein [Symploca sp. SIO2C1]